MTDTVPSTGAEWVARMNAGPLSPELQAALDSWLARDSRNQADFTLARLTWSVAKRLETSDVAQQELRALNAQPISRRWNLRLWNLRFWGAAANPFASGAHGWSPAFAAIALIIVGAVGYLQFPRAPADPSFLQNGASAATAIGEISNYTLPDGSKLTVNAKSSVRVAFNRKQRQIFLEHGEAFFEVQRDAKPFVVTAGARSVVVTGTKFDVKLDSYRSGLQVAVVEGHVNVGDGQPEAADVTALRANDVFLFPDNGPPERLTLAANLVSAWQSRRLHFEGTMIGDVLNSVNRFAIKPLQVGDPQLAELPLSGAFNAGDTDAVLFSLQSLYGIEATDTGSALILNMAR